MKTSILLFAMLIVSAGYVVAQEPIAYPKDYRQWTHVKSMVLHKDHPLATPFAGIHHIYANPKGVDGLQNGRFKKGAKIVFDLMENPSANGASTEGQRKLLGVMVKDNNRFAQTGGWGFEAWQGNSREKRLTSDGGQSCFQCHTAEKNHDYVFSRWRN